MGLMAGLCALAVISASAEAWGCGVLLILGLCGWLVLAALWASRLAIRVALRWHYGRERAGNWRVVRWLTTPASVVIAVGLVASGWPAHTVFVLSRSALTAYVNTLEPVSAPTVIARYDPPRMVGLYAIKRVDRWPNAARLSISGLALMGDVGLVYSPDSDPREWMANTNEALPGFPCDSQSFDPLGDGWYRWSCSW